MLKPFYVAAACACLAACALAAAEPDAMDAGWSYSGDGGPARWGDLAPLSQPAPRGEQQSPIDINETFPSFVSGPAIDWTAVKGGEVVNTGRTLQVNLNGAGGVTLDGIITSSGISTSTTRPSIKLEGRSYPLEVHFVHEAVDGRLAVVGVFFEEGEESPTLKPIWTTAPTTDGKAAVSFNIDPADMLPADDSGFRYAGSLTTPPVRRSSLGPS